MRRLVLRARDALRRSRPWSYLADYALYISLAGVGLALVVLVLLTASTAGANQQTTGLLPILQAQAVNVLSLALLGGAAFAWYQVIYRQARRTYLSRCRRRSTPSAADEAHLAPLATTIVGQLLDVRPPRSSLVVTDDAEIGAAVLAQVTRTIAAGRQRRARRLLPVTVDVSQADGNTGVPALVQDCFVQLFTEASADRPRAERLLRREMRRHRVVALLSGLDRVAEARSEAYRRLLVASLLRSCLEEKLPFVSSLAAELVTPMSDVAVLRELPATIEGQAEALVRRIGAVVQVDQSALTREVVQCLDDRVALSRWQARLAADVVTLEHRSGVPLRKALQATLEEPDSDVRQLRWMARLTHDAAVGSEDAEPPVQRALAALGLAAHYRQELTVPEQALRAGAGGNQLDVELGLWGLARRGVVSITGDADPAAQGRSARFTRPEWFSFAGACAMGLDGRHWCGLLRPEVSQATLEALTFALVSAESVPARSPVSLLAGLRNGRSDNLTLEMLTAVTRGLRRHGVLDVGSREVEALERAWQVSSQQGRLAFIRALEPHPELAAFCWSRALPSGGGDYAVRRAAARRVASMGEPAWRRLCDEWDELVTAAEHLDLRDTTRSARPDSDWVRVARPFATLGWTLPSLLAVLDSPHNGEALSLLQRMRARVARPPGAADGAPDVGLEISLAEGIKLAAGVLPAPGPNAIALLEEGRALFSAARSWSSKVVLLQAVALAAAHHRALDVEAVAAREAEHPFVREAAWLTTRRRLTPGEQDIWLDDVQSLQDGGLELSDQAHRLLALTTLLINLAERQARPPNRAPTDAELHRRTTALTSTRLPSCFLRQGHTATMFQVPCDCDFRLCGTDVTGTIGDRRFSAAFAQRAEVTAACRPLTPGRPFVTGGFARVWRREEVLRDAKDQALAAPADDVEIDGPRRRTGVSAPKPESVD